VLGISDCFSLSLQAERRLSEDDQEFVDVVFEKVQADASLKDTHYDNFLLRKKVYSRTKSLSFVVFAPYVAVN